MLHDSVLSTAHPQMLSGGANDTDLSNFDSLSFVAMRINGVMRLLQNPQDFQLGGTENIDAVETFRFLSRTSLGCILLKETPLSDLSDPRLTAIADNDGDDDDDDDDVNTTEDLTGALDPDSDPDPVSTALKKIGLSKTLYYNNSKVYTFNPPFEIDLISFFQLPDPAGAAREVVLWLEYSNPSDYFPESRYVTFPVALSLGGVLKLEQIGGVPTLRRAAIVHSPSPDITCRVYFDDVPRAENEGIPFTRTTPFEGPSEGLLGVICY